jgi:hypothetical protein
MEEGSRQGEGLVGLLNLPSTFSTRARCCHLAFCFPWKRRPPVSSGFHLDAPRRAGPTGIAAGRTERLEILDGMRITGSQRPGTVAKSRQRSLPMEGVQLSDAAEISHAFQQRGRTVFLRNGGVDRDRTCDLLIANETLYQLSYDPTQKSRRLTIVSVRPTQAEMLE